MINYFNIQVEKVKITKNSFNGQAIKALSAFQGSIYYFYTMQSNKNDPFEDALKEILSSEDPHSSSRIPAPMKDSDTIHRQKPPPAQPHSTSVPRWIEILVRVVAGIIIVVLLFLFGIQVALR
jgi:hypothetical protein